MRPALIVGAAAGTGSTARTGGGSGAALSHAPRTDTAKRVETSRQIFIRPLPSIELDNDRGLNRFAGKRKGGYELILVLLVEPFGPFELGFSLG